jgi:hypothetical protein
MPELDKIISEKNFVTDRISTQVRIIAIGLLATSWTLLIGQTNIFKDMLQCFRIHFILISFIAIITLVFDFLHYKFSYLNIDKLIKFMKDKGLTKADYKDDECFKCSQFFFIVKQYTLLVGVAYFIVCMIIVVLA